MEVTNTVYFDYGYSFLKSESIFYWIIIFAITNTIRVCKKPNLKVILEYRKRYKSVKILNKMDNFLLNEWS